MRKLLLALAAVLLLAAPVFAEMKPVKVTESYGKGNNVFSLATGSPGELGLLRELGEAFGKKHDVRLDWVKAGSGESLEYLKGKQVDMIMVHAPAAEKKAVAEGWASGRTLIGSNEFFVVGPASDPAHIAHAKTAAEAYQKIAAARATFFSRGDDSGTHRKEMSIWKMANVQPSGDWYNVTKAFMTATLKRANDEGGYFMTDSSTWASEKKSLPGLKILFKGDKYLVNTYHALAAPAGTTAGAKTAQAFIDFVASDAGQEIFRSYGKKTIGEALYDDAKYAKQYDD
ncbi:MAG: substrate-binding domain-containing protein [Humidesulfovibrio sp.]|uniref:substrate-binding domain-containing protein n=1 Tax=Humidesulfovibrio sp. TaxID=2910988 RepID=UPI0027375FDA|nr:substrate-binding domain-containing protein [Humidesulfovibrio sp.]MDP2849389.1 substrate-binding domain-containing protein [Humidesulfovibrio sp.]